MVNFLSAFLSVFQVPLRDYVALWAALTFVLGVTFGAELIAAVVLMSRAGQ